MSFLVTLAKWTMPDFRAVARDSNVPQLLTLGFSHYNELARWTLQAAGIAFDESAYAPVQHVLPALSVRVGKTKEDNVPMTTTKVEVVRKESAPGPEEPSTLKPSMTALPLLVLPDGRVLKDSWDVSTWAATRAGLAPAPPALIKLLDEEVGPLSRQLVYSYVLAARNENVFEAMCTENTHWFWRFVWFWCGVKGVVLKRMRAIFKPDAAAPVVDCRTKLQAVVRRLDAEFVVNKKGKYLLGDELSQADIALASMMAILVNPDEYALGRYKKYMQAFQAQDAALAEETRMWRATPTGQYAVHVYATARTYTVK